MNSFELNIIDDKARAGSDFMARVVDEIRRALIAEKSKRKLTQQEIAEKIGTSRAVINRQVQGLENLTARRVGELLWAIGWEPHFEAREIPAGENYSCDIDQESVPDLKIEWPKETALQGDVANDNNAQMFIRSAGASNTSSSITNLRILSGQ